MYKPKKPEKPESTNRLRLDVETKLPSIFTIEQQFEECKARRGCQIELPWHGTKPAQLFTLSVQWDASADLPIWTLYEQTSLESKMHWSEQYPPGDLQIMYDVVVMSITSTEPSAVKIPDNLRPTEPPSAKALSAPAPISAPKPVMAPPQPAPPIPPVPPMPAAAPPMMPAPYPYPMPGYPMDPQAMPPPGYPMPAYPVDPQNMPPGYPMPGQYPVDPQAMPPGYPPYPYPYAPQPGAPGMQYAMPPGMPPGMPPPGWYPNPAMQPGQAPPGAAAAPPMPPQVDAPAPPAPSAPTIDYTLISKRAKVQLGKLLVEARIISQTTLDAALKLQELVEDGQVTLDEAPEALQLHHSKGASIDQFLNQKEAELPSKREEQPKIGEIPESSKLPISPPKSGAEGKAAFDLLQKAGLITEQDLISARGVRQKHGGNFIQILQHAGKLDKYTFESAVACLPLIQLGLMKVEQCIIAVQYCNRMRVDFDTALEELGWQNPRKLRSDLQL